MPFAGQTIKALDFTPPVFAAQPGNEDNFTNTTFETGANICGISFIAPTSGRGTVHFHARFGSIDPDITNANVSVHVRTGDTINAGTTVTGGAPDQDDSLENPGAGTTTTTSRLGASTYRHIEGLTAGAAYNAVLVHSVDSGTATIFHRTILWVPSP